MPTLTAALHAAVAALGGAERAGQTRMAQAVESAVDSGEHLLVQAGTGTGKSLAYLVPALLHASSTGAPVVVATATLALQGQIIDRDLPRLAEALTPLLGRRPRYALVKGRRNYVCKHKLAGGFPPEDDAGLFELADVSATASRLGADVVRLRTWAADTDSGDRDELVPGVSERAWRQVSVSAEECLGNRCPMSGECFVERAREIAKDVDVVVTNHAFMAIDAFEGRFMLPEHDVLIIDEAHELVDRITSTITDELTPGMVRAAARKAGKGEEADRLDDCAVALEAALERLPESRIDGIPEQLALALATVRDAARALQTQLKPASGEAPDGARQVALAAVDEVFETGERMLAERDLDVLWNRLDPRRGPVLHVAPMSVATLVRDRVFSNRTVILTSATLALGGSFDALAGTIGLRGEGAPAYAGIDVGSPFDYRGQAIAYVAAQLPPPGRSGLSEAALDEIETLIRAAGGRTLGLFSSMRAAREAAEAMRDRLGESGFEILCQGDDQVATLVRAFAREPTTCLFGTLTLWQGVDVPGASCQLVLIDRIPFPRPDDPLASARTEAIGRMGGNGFMAVSATHAALRLAQGAGRLIRGVEDRGVVAFLDSRMVNARYAGFLQRSLPPFWPTTDRALVLQALQRLDQTAPPPVPVAEPGRRTPGGGPEPVVAASATEVVDQDGAAHAKPVVSDPPVAPSARTAVTQGHPWTEQDDEELRDGVDMGLTIDELAESLELPEVIIRARLAGLGLTAEGAPQLT
jgi:ATP-dependent DNA helicase DinG